MKKILVLALATIMLVTALAACGGGGSSGGGTINVWSFTDEIPNAILRYKEMNPDFAYDINVTVIATDGGGYQQALDQALQAGGADAPHIFTAESAFVLKYSQVDAAHLALPYSELFGQDVGPMIRQLK